MLLEFAVENFRSFKDLQILSLEARKGDEAQPGLNQVTNIKGGYRAVKTKAIYGANSSGKSNLILALVAMWKIVEGNLRSREVLSSFITPYKLDEDLKNSPSYFQIIFTSKGKRFRYGFEADSEKIHSEWLYVKREIEVVLFEREFQNLVELNGTSFKEGKIIKKGIKMFTERSLVISILDQLDGEISVEVVKSILSNIVISANIPNQDNFWYQRTLHVFEEDDAFARWVKRLLCDIDKSIDDVKLKTIELPSGGETKIPIILRGDAPFLLKKEEASGTQKLFDFSSIIFRCLKEGHLFIVDEWDALLHPLLTKYIVNQFHSIDSHENSQIIFVTHDTSLLDQNILRRDQIAFVEKSKVGSSEVFDLSEIKGVRATDYFGKNYLKGNYGALPILNDVNYG